MHEWLAADARLHKEMPALPGLEHEWLAPDARLHKEMPALPWARAYTLLKDMASFQALCDRECKKVPCTRAVDLKGLA